jgi:hypothetical protein
MLTFLAWYISTSIIKKKKWRDSASFTSPKDREMVDYIRRKITDKMAYGRLNLQNEIYK